MLPSLRPCTSKAHRAFAMTGGDAPRETSRLQCGPRPRPRRFGRAPRLLWGAAPRASVRRRGLPQLSAAGPGPPAAGVLVHPPCSTGGARQGPPEKSFAPPAKESRNQNGAAGVSEAASSAAKAPNKSVKGDAKPKSSNETRPKVAAKPKARAAATSTTGSRTPASSSADGNSSVPTCSYCSKTGHDADRCSFNPASASFRGPRASGRAKWPRRACRSECRRTASLHPQRRRGSRWRHRSRRRPAARRGPPRLARYAVGPVAEAPERGRFAALVGRRCPARLRSVLPPHL